MRKMEASSVARSIAGRDKGRLFIVLNVAGRHAGICDGKLRRTYHIKNKGLRHLEYAGECDDIAAERIRNGEKISDIEIRRALARFCARSPDQPRRSKLGKR